MTENKVDLSEIIANSDEVEQAAEELEQMPEQQKELDGASSKYDV